MVCSGFIIKGQTVECIRNDASDTPCSKSRYKYHISTMCWDVETALKNMGVCVKCGELRPVRQHHAFGYDSEKTLTYCHSCDSLAHIRAIKTGKCILSSEERKRLSSISSNRRTRLKKKRQSNRQV